MNFIKATKINTRYNASENKNEYSAGLAIMVNLDNVAYAESFASEGKYIGTEIVFNAVSTDERLSVLVQELPMSLFKG